MIGLRWSVTSAGLGGIAWLFAPSLPFGTRPALGSLEHVFLFLPLVAAPLALALLATLRRPEGGSAPRAYRLARRIQPAAAAMVLGSFLTTKGTSAGVLTMGWVVMASIVAAGGLSLVRRGGRANPSLVAAHVFLPIGAVWLLLSRLGVGPRSFSELTVFLAAVHFHFSGFTLQILIAATGRALEASRSRLCSTHRGIALGAIAGIPLIAAGNALAVPALKAIGVAFMVLSVVGLAITSVAVARASASRITRGLLLVSSVSVATAMVVAALYGAGELTGSSFISLARMVTVHGLANAVGFTFCGLSAHLHAALLPARRLTCVPVH